MAMQLLVRLWKDEQGGELLEFVLVAGLVVACVAGAISMMGHRAAATLTSPMR